jgi:ssDNA-binding Zn-finger/Zn-ribbon topoisomerase 1
MEEGETTAIEVTCPQCGAKAVYRYGKYREEQKYTCVVCGRQFIPGHERRFLNPRPVCDRCGKKMHLYMDADKYTRFRCSGYPECRSFLKVLKTDPRRENELLHP